MTKRKLQVDSETWVRKRGPGVVQRAANRATTLLVQIESAISMGGATFNHVNGGHTLVMDGPKAPPNTWLHTATECIAMALSQF